MFLGQKYYVYNYLSNNPRGDLYFVSLWISSAFVTFFPYQKNYALRLFFFRQCFNVKLSFIYCYKSHLTFHFHLRNQMDFQAAFMLVIRATCCEFQCVWVVAHINTLHFLSISSLFKCNIVHSISILKFRTLWMTQTIITAAVQLTILWCFIIFNHF